MRKCIATVSISGTLADKLDAIATARFDAIEVFENDLINFTGTPHDLRRMAVDRGLGIDLYQPFRDLDADSDAQFRRNLDRAERKFDLMQVLEAPMLLVCSNASATASKDDARIAAQLNELAERAARRNLRIAYEALAWGRARQPLSARVGNRQEGGSPASRRLPWTAFIFSRSATTPPASPRSRVKRSSFCRWRMPRAWPWTCCSGAVTIVPSRARASSIWPAFSSACSSPGYTGPFSLEVFNDVFREVPNRPTAVDAMRSILYCEAETRLRLERADASAPSAAKRSATLDRVELFDPPAPSELAGVAFVEFALDATAAPMFDTFLQAFGFRRLGRHRSKNVTLYRQGAIHVVVNLEPDSFAHAYFDEHGASLVAVGLATSDSVRALNRATAFHWARFDTRVGRHEFNVPAVRAPDGTLVYFVPLERSDRRTVRDRFRPVRPRLKRRASRDAGLTRIDHIARGLPIEALDTWILFHRAVLGNGAG